MYLWDHAVAVSMLLIFGLPCSHVTWAFCLDGTNGILRQFQRNISTRLPLQLSMSDSMGSGSGGNDELSKLISKRSQIKRVKKDTLEEAQEKLATSIEPVVDLDLDTLPNFSYERTPRRRDESENNDGDIKLNDGQKKKEADAPIVDFMADYPDENDWHVANRIGVTSVCWGDPSKNFISSSNGGKLTKRLQKAGKFVAGDVQMALTKLLAGGVTLVETSPSYGLVSRGSKLSAEHILKQCFQEQGQESDLSMPEAVVVENLGSGLAAWKAMLRPGSSMVSSLEDSLQRLGNRLSSVDLFLAPMLPGVPTRLVAAGLAAQIESGQSNCVGVSGATSPRQLQRLVRHLESRDCVLTANAFCFSLTNPRHEEMIATCKEAGVVPLILNPLDGGLSSGVYTATNPSGGITAGGGSKPPFSFAQLDKLQPLHSVLETISDRVRTRVTRGMRDTQERFKSKFGPPPKINTDITTTQVALHWIISKGGVPLVEVNSPTQADEVLGCLGWTLTDDEVDMIDSAVALCKL